MRNSSVQYHQSLRTTSHFSCHSGKPVTKRNSLLLLCPHLRFSDSSPHNFEAKKKNHLVFIWSQVTLNQLRTKWINSLYWLMKLLQDTISYSFNGFSVGTCLSCAPDAISSIDFRLSQCNSHISAPPFFYLSLPNVLTFPPSPHGKLLLLKKLLVMNKYKCFTQSM